MDFGYPVGPLALLDEVGIDIGAHVSKEFGSLYESRGLRASQALPRLFEAGYQGRKNKRGFYRYDRKRKGPKPVDQTIYAYFGGKSRRRIPHGEMADRLSLLMANEAVWCLQEEVIACPGTATWAPSSASASRRSWAAPSGTSMPSGWTPPAACCWPSARNTASDSSPRRFSIRWRGRAGASTPRNTRHAKEWLAFCKGLHRSGDRWAARPKPRACLRIFLTAVGFAQPSAGREGVNPFSARLVNAACR